MRVGGRHYRTIWPEDGAVVTGLITGRGIAVTSREGLLALYPEQAAA